MSPSLSLLVVLFSAGVRVAFPPRTLLQHILFIKTLKEAAELEQLRHARTKMSEVYPLTPGEASTAAPCKPNIHPTPQEQRPRSPLHAIGVENPGHASITLLQKFAMATFFP